MEAGQVVVVAADRFPDDTAATWQLKCDDSVHLVDLNAPQSVLALSVLSVSDTTLEKSNIRMLE